MFTGIIEEIGKVADFTKSAGGDKLKINCSKVLEGTKTGDSISVNGCCQTVVFIGKDWFETDVSKETLNMTTFAAMKKGDPVNLERALTPQFRLGGHIVQGHIDCTGRLLKVEQSAEFYNMYFEIPENMMKYVVKKGSIAVNGISLTIANITGNKFSAAVIPHTYKNTNLKNLKTGDFVNIETDIIGRYVEKFLSLSNNESRIDENFLIENGFM